ncbi:hypothetical protein [Gelria sp. Kuro-4]|uniref:hypothetical protein n=1 Tax=Gelria sp. Kuro-4 TaxID=2796927 RepID=UPI001BED5896|nr:hypothetical protein [Gelria sp. Kuro-4]BCV23816.1 hypothetical protein kuro4_05890 [Gelria sp. Kuro-4]
MSSSARALGAPFLVLGAAVHLVRSIRRPLASVREPLSAVAGGDPTHEVFQQSTTAEPAQPAATARGLTTLGEELAARVADFHLPA